jgi:DNA-binding NarL/FixJ family response regulator
MPTTNLPKTILLVSNNQDLIETTRTNLGSNELYDLIAEMGNLEKLSDTIAEAQPNLILLDFDFAPEPLQFAQELISTYPQIAFVPILTEAHMANADQVMLTGARVFVKYPINRTRSV